MTEQGVFEVHPEDVMAVLDLFDIISFVALGVSYSTFLILSVVDPSGVPQIHQAIGIIPATLINYFLNSYWTFKE